MRRSEAGVKPIQLSLSPDGKRLAVTYRTDPATTKLYDISGLKAK
jgi:hypothetical protein